MRPSTTAETLRSEPPASKPMRQPSRCPPMGRAAGRGSGKRSPAVSTQKGRPYTVSIMATSKAREPWGLKLSRSREIRTSSPLQRHPPSSDAPQQQLDGALQISQIGRASSTDACLVHHGAAPLHGDAEGLSGLGQIGRPPRGKGQKVRLQAGSILYGKRDARYSIAGSSLWALYWQSSAGCSSGRRAVSTAPRYTTSRS